MVAMATIMDPISLWYILYDLKCKDFELFNVLTIFGQLFGYFIPATRTDFLVIKCNCVIAYSSVVSLLGTIAEVGT